MGIVNTDIPLCPICNKDMSRIGKWIRNSDPLVNEHLVRYECRCDGRVHATVRCIKEETIDAP